MNEFLSVLGAVLPVFCVVGSGFALRKLNWLTEEADQSLLRVTINLLVPCLIFDSVLQNAALRQIGNLLLAPAIGFVTVVLGIGAALLISRWTGLQQPRERRTFAVGVGLYNYGYVPLPLALLLFSNETVGVLFVHNVGVEIALWTVAFALLSGGSMQATWKKLINPPLVAILVALILNLTHSYDLLPRFALVAVKMLGQCAIPVALILTGALVADHLHEFHSGQGWRVIVWACVLRLGVLPICFLLIAKYLPCSVELKQVIVLQAAMPAAVFPLVMAKHYGGDPSTALRVLVGTSVVGLVTIPLWIRFGLKFVEL